MLDRMAVLLADHHAKDSAASVESEQRRHAHRANRQLPH
jgi:hypothetical protein